MLFIQIVYVVSFYLDLHMETYSLFRDTTFHLALALSASLRPK